MKAKAKPLEGRVALVTGATRGAGRGIARALGEAGATVYCTGRSTRGASATPGRPESIEETAELVDAAGGKGIAVRCDHTNEAEVVALVARIEAEAKQLDVLVNDIWGGDAVNEWGKPFWETSIEKGRLLFERGLFSHIVTSRHAVPLMVRARRGLVVEIGDGSGLYYRDSFFYDLVKTSILRVAFAMAEELRPHGVTALALTPGYLRSEAMLEEHFGVTEATWREAIAKDPHFAQSETPLFVGRAVAALAADPRVFEKTGGSFDSGSLAEEYGFSDADGSRPNWARYFEANFGEVLARKPRFA